MARIIKLSLMILILLGASFQAALGEDGLRIDVEDLEINNIVAQSARSFTIFKSMGATSELIGPRNDYLLRKYAGARDGYIPARGFTAVGDDLYGHFQDTFKMDNKKYTLIKVELDINHTSDVAKTFRLGDITLMARGVQIGFIAVGPNGLAYMAKSAEDLKSMADVIYDMEPDDTRRFTYIFIAQRKSKSWILSYQEEGFVELDVK